MITMTTTTTIIGSRFLVSHHGIGDDLHLFEIKGLIEGAPRRGGCLVQPEPKRPGAVIRGVQQVLHLTRLRLAKMALDHTATPIVRARVTQRTEDTTERRG
ncbi:MAG: hypothetical protein WCJ87_07200 [Burkholderiales bacterium]